MNTKIQTLLVALAAAGLIACGGEETQQVECADGTEFDEDANECVLSVPECDDDQAYVEEFNTCVSTGDALCGDGTQYDGDQGRCTAPELECGENTGEEDGECVFTDDLSCGEGTVAYDGQCVAADEVCGDGTTDMGTGAVTECRPGEDLCGDGTVFDAAAMRCIPESQLVCGYGTVQVDDQCVPAHGYYQNLADDPDLDLTDVDGVADMELADAGEQFVFIGTIDAPQDRQQQYDQLQFSADEGQWLQITVYSLGIPEPGFEFQQDASTAVDEPFYRHSDLGAGIETTRQMVVPEDGEYELTVGNMPQMIDYAEPAGGDDWQYVGVVETMPTPEALEVDIEQAYFGGDLQQLTDNFYVFQDLTDITNLQMFVEEFPADTDAELQLWDADNQLVETIEVDDTMLSVPIPGDELYLLFDYEYATGFSTDYQAVGRPAHMLDDGDTLTMDVELSGGEYGRLSQFNTDGADVSATAYNSDGEAIGHNDQLASGAEDEHGASYLYWYSPVDQTVTVEVENNSGSQIESLATELEIKFSQAVPDVDGSPVSVTHSQTMTAGQRHYLELDVDYDDRLLIDTGDEDAYLELFDEQGETVAFGNEQLFFEAQTQLYGLYVEAQQQLTGGFSLTVEQTDLYSVDKPQQVNEDIPTSQEPLTSTISVEDCPVIEDIEVFLEITHNYREDLEVTLLTPGAGEVTLHDGSGGPRNDVIGTYPYPDDEFLEDGEGLLDAIGTSGEGNWQLEIIDTWATIISQGELKSWSLHLVCKDE